MLNSNALILCEAIDTAINTGKFKPDLKERAFITRIGSIARTPQRLSDKQGKWLEQIYRISRNKW